MIASSQIGAFFDLDGTLVAAPSLEWRFVAYLLAHDDIGVRQIGRWAAQYTRMIWRDTHAATHANKLYLAGLSESLAVDWQNSIAPKSATTDQADRPSLPIFAEAIERMAWHSALGHKIFFVTGTIEPLAHAFVRFLAQRGLACCAEVCATPLETRHGAWTGRLAGVHMSGWEKAMALRVIAARYSLSLAESYAYGDSWTDLRMLETIGHPVAVNPRRRLGGIARRRGWDVCHWCSLNAHTHAICNAASNSADSTGKPRVLAAGETP